MFSRKATHKVVNVAKRFNMRYFHLNRPLFAYSDDEEILSPSSYVRIPPKNWCISIVPQQMSYVVERFGKYHRTLDSGIHLLIPLVDRVSCTLNVG